MTYIGFVARILFAAVFLVAAVRKAFHPSAFVQTIHSIGFRALPSQGIAWLMIVYEATLGILFLLGVFPLIAILAAFVLLAMFVGISVYVIRSSQLIPCSCFGESETPLGSQTLWRAVLLGIPVAIYYLSVRGMIATWWPTDLNTWINLLCLALSAMLLTRWLLVANVLKTLVHTRQLEERLLEGRHEQIIIERLRRQGAPL